MKSLINLTYFYALSIIELTIEVFNITLNFVLKNKVFQYY